VKRHEHCVVVVSEGTRRADGSFLAASARTDAFGHAQLGGAAVNVAAIVSEHLGLKCHYAIADYLQRSARHIASKIDVQQAYAVGKAAVEFALAGENGIMPVIVRDADSPYRWHIGKAKLTSIANKEKKLPRRYITKDGFGITAACRRYLQPLIRGEDFPPFRNGVPRYPTLRNRPVPRLLGTDFVLD
jgi:6-phosphofructokinase 1